MFTAVVYIPASDAIALSLMNLIFARLFLGEQVRKYRWSGALCAFMGALILLRPEDWQVNPVALVCIAGAVALGLEIIIIKILSSQEKPLQILVISNAIGSVIATAPLFFIGNIPQGTQWVALMAIGALMAFGQLLFLLAMLRFEASLVAPYIYATLLFVMVLDFVVLGVHPDFWSLTGAGIIICSGAFIAYREQKRE